MTDRPDQGRIPATARRMSDGTLAVHAENGRLHRKIESLRARVAELERRGGDAERAFGNLITSIKGYQGDAALSPSAVLWEISKARATAAGKGEDDV